MSELTYATICSGIECMSAAVGPLGGWKPVFFSEIEPFPCSLLKHRYPTVPNLGDITRITAERIGDDKWRITNGAAEIELAGRLGCLAGGTPCQDVSNSGKRAGMAEGSGTRSSLAFHFARLCRELQPRWVVWENVPGVLTSNGGRDFAHFVRSIGECGYSLAYRTLDAQWVRVDGLPRAVPQRRRRVWLVGHLGNDWRAPAEVLFEPEGVRGDTPPRRVTWQGTTEAARGRARLPDGVVGRAGGFNPYEPGGVKTLNPGLAGTLITGDKNYVCEVYENHQTDARTQEVDVALTMGATHNAQAANNNPLVVAIDMDKNKSTNADKPVRKGGAGFGVSEKGASYTLTARDQHAVAYAIDSMGSNAMKSKNPKSGCRQVECAPTLTTVDSDPVKHQGGTAVVAFLPGNSKKARSVAAEEEVSPTLMRTQGESGNEVAVAAEVVGVFDMGARKTGAGTDTSGVSPTVLAQHGTDPHAVCIGFDSQMGGMNTSPKPNLSETLAVSHQCGVAIGLDRASFNQGKNAKFGFAVEYIVRRLTPLECERLQGLPDGYTRIPYRGKSADECPDSPRYKALGNGWAVNCARWICQRIQKYDVNQVKGTVK